MTKRYGSVKISTLLSVALGIVSVVTAAIIIALVNYNMRQQALAEAEAKMRLILDRNVAVHTYFSQILKPDLFGWTDPFRSADYFDPSWMSSSYAVREMGKYFKALSPTDYYYKDAVVNARNPENEADADERAFLVELQTNPSLKERSSVRTIDGKPYLVVLQPGEMLEASCLRCHGNPQDAPGDLVRQYGPERSFWREAELGTIVSAVSVRVPLAVAFAEVDRISRQLSTLLLVLLGLLFAAQFWLPRRLVFTPLAAIRDQALQVSTDENRLGEQVPIPFGQELSEMAIAFNGMSATLRSDRDRLEARVDARTADLTIANERLERDIIERKRIEEALRHAHDDLARSNTDLERFAYVASHDLQEPLRMVASFVGLLAKRYRGQLDSDADEFIGFAVDGAKRMQTLINDLLEYSRVGTRSEPLQPTDANVALADALWNLDLAITDASATVTHDPLPTVLADPTQLAQLFQNLIGNAIKFHGTETPVVHIAAQETFEVSETSKVWRFSVRDNGIGIAPQDHARIFGIFQRLHSREEYAGTGIGLAVCQRIVERHGGRIWVESQVGQGTTFYFTLPVAA